MGTAATISTLACRITFVMDCKPDKGGEIQTLADVFSGIVICLKVVKSAGKEKAIAKVLDLDPKEGAYGKGTRVLLELMKTWLGGNRLVTTDTYSLKERDTDFIGNVKQCNAAFPKAYLDTLILSKRRDCHVLALINEDTGKIELVAMTWLDCNWRDFVGTAYGIGEGEKISCKRACQLNKSSNAPPNKIIIKVETPKMIEQYHKGVGTIDFHNRVCVDEVPLERNILTKDSARRFNLSICGMICVNTSLFYQCIVHERNKKGIYRKFFGSLTDELIDSTQGIHTARTAIENQAAEVADAVKPPTLRWTVRTKKRKGSGGGKEGVSQGRCRHKSCKVYLSHVCSKCTHPSDPLQKQFWFCNHTTRGGSECWKEHLKVAHGIGN